MRRFAFAFIFIITFLTFGEDERAEREYGIGLNNTYSLGQASYELKTVLGIFNIKTRRNEDYPINHYAPGIHLYMKNNKVNEKKSILFLDFSTNLTQPDNMCIYEYGDNNLTDPPIYNQEIKHFEGEQNMRYYYLAAGFKGDFLILEGIHFGLMGGFQWNKIDTDVENISGWYRPDITQESLAYLDANNDTRIEYDAVFRALYIGIDTNYPHNNWKLGLDFKFSPITKTKATEYIYDLNNINEKLEQESEDGLFYEYSFYFDYLLELEKFDLKITTYYRNLKYDMSGTTNIAISSVTEETDEDNYTTDFILENSKIGLNLSLLL